MDKNFLLAIEDEVKDLISELGISVTVKVDFDESLGTVGIQIDSSEAAALIGFHGEMLQSIQLISSFLVHKKLGEWFKVLVNVGDYRQKREEQLRNLAMNLAMKVKFSGEAQTVSNLIPSERRIVHLALSGNPDVTTESEGEGKERRLIIKPKAQQ